MTEEFSYIEAQRIRALLAACDEHGCNQFAAGQLFEQGIDCTAKINEATLRDLQNGRLFLVSRERLESILDELEVQR